MLNPRVNRLKNELHLARSLFRRVPSELNARECERIYLELQRLMEEGLECAGADHRLERPGVAGKAVTGPSLFKITQESWLKRAKPQG